MLTLSTPKVLFLLVLLLAAGMVLHTLGLVSFTQQYKNTVTVTGSAEGQQKNEVASFTASVSVTDDDKATAVKQVEEYMNEIIKAVKAFGVPEADLRTANMNIYQNQEEYYDDGRRKMREGQWNVSNSVDIKLKDASKADALASLLASTKATNVYGPNFTVDDYNSAGDTLIDEAISNAREKAEKIARASNRRLGKVLYVTEGYTPSYYPVMMEGRGGGGGGYQVGTTEVNKAVTVTFELK